MANDPKLRARFELDTSHARRAMQDASKSIKANAGTIITSFVGPVASVAALTEGLRRAITASNEHERVIKRAERAGFANVRAVDAWAESLQRVSGVSSDVILNQAAITKSLGSSEAQAKRFTEASLELAAALGRDVTSVQNQLNKTLGGTLGELAELVPAMKRLTAAQLEAGAAADYILKEYAGSAAAQGGTVSGRVQTLQQSVDDWFQSVGDLLKAITGNGAGTNALGTVFDSWTNSISALTDAINDGREPIRRFFTDTKTGMEQVLAAMGGFYNFAVRSANMQNVLPLVDVQATSDVGVGGAMYGPNLPPGGVQALRGRAPLNVGAGVQEYIRPTLDAGVFMLSDGTFYWANGSSAASNGAPIPETGFSVNPFGGNLGAGSGANLPFVNPPDYNPQEERQREIRDREYIRDLTEQSMNTLTQSLLDSIFYARDLSDVFKNLLRDIIGSVAQQGVKSFVASLIPGASVATAGGGSYTIGPSDNNPALQQQARELSRQMSKSRRRGF